MCGSPSFRKNLPSASSSMQEPICLNRPPVTTFPEGRPFDMTDLMQKLIEAGQTVVGFPIMEYWLDVGRHEDYQKAQEDVLRGKDLTRRYSLQVARVTSVPLLLRCCWRLGTKFAYWTIGIWR